MLDAEMDLPAVLPAVEFSEAKLGRWRYDCGRVDGVFHRVRGAD